MSKQEKNLEDVPFDETGQSDKSKVSISTDSLKSSEIMSPADERDKIYKDILKDYKKQTKKRKKQIKNFRDIIFWTIFSIMICFTVFGLVTLIVMLCLGGSLLGYISSISSLVLAGFVLPLIVTRNLFPPKEEENIIKVVEALIQNDENLRQHKDKK